MQPTASRILRNAISFLLVVVCALQNDEQHVESNLNNTPWYQNWTDFVSLLEKWHAKDFSLVSEMESQQNLIEDLKLHASNLPVRHFEKEEVTLNTEFINFLGRLSNENYFRALDQASLLRSILGAMVEYENTARNVNTEHFSGISALSKATELEVLALSVKSSAYLLNQMMRKLRSRLSYTRFSLNNLKWDFSRLHAMQVDICLRFDQKSFQVEQILSAIEVNFGSPIMVMTCSHERV